jgi:hypothetical protein
MSEQNDNEANQESAAISDIGKDVKKGMDKYETKMRKSAALEEESSPAGDSTRSEE